MSRSFHSFPSREGSLALITGANSGIGFDTAKALLEKGFTVILGCRSLKKAEIARDKLLNQTDSERIDVLVIDLSDLSKVNKSADEIINKFKRLDLLINNAGVMAPPYTVTPQGLELQFAVNHLSHMALSLKLLPLLSQQKGARIVTVSSATQYMGSMNWNDLQGKQKYDRWASYSQSKLANVMFALELHYKLTESNMEIASLSAHPGLARTNLQPKSVELNGSWQEAIAYKLMDPLFQSSRMGALPQLFAATDPKAKSGEQYGPRFNFRGSPRLCRIAPSALKTIERERLWNKSEQLICDFVDISQGKEILSKKT